MNFPTLLEKVKIAYLRKTIRCQISLFDEKGGFLASCQTFFKLPYRMGDNLFEINPFFDSIREAVMNLKEGEELVFPRVETAIEGERSEIFDYIIYKSLDNQSHMIVWVMRDVEGLLSDTIIKQRIGAIQNEMLAIQNRNIMLENELITLKNQQLEKEKRFKNEFFAKASHDLRAPINNMIGILHLMDLEDQSKMGQYFKVMNHIASHMKILVDDLLDLTKLESGIINYNPHDFDLHQLIENTQLGFLPQTREKNLYFKTSISPEVPVMIKADSLRLSQILFNLISNAIKFTSKGGIELNLSLQSPNVLFVSVKDTGCGIMPDKLERIFEPFVQEQIDTQHIHGGTGLGLAIVKQIVELQGGQIFVESKVGVGSTFSFTLPFEQSTTIIPAPSPLLITPDLSQKSLLVVDDAILNLLVIKSNLSNLGVKITTVTDGMAAINLLEKEEFDLLLLDMELPGMSGGQVLEIYRKNPHLKRPPVILITGYDQSSVTNLFPELIYDDILKKPFEKTDLQQKVIKWLTRDNPLKPE